MAKKRSESLGGDNIPRYMKTLIDSQTGIHEAEWEMTAGDLGQHAPGGNPWNLHKFTLRGGKQHGVDILSVDNGVLDFDVVLSRGMGILDASCNGMFLGWNSPVGGPGCEAIHPSYVRLEEANGFGWLTGFNEWFVRCGMTHNGAPGVDSDGKLKNLHGGIANTPASFVQVSVGLEPPYFISVQGVVIESIMFGHNLRLDTTLTTAPGANWMVVQDRITNLRAVPSECQMLYHINYGGPLLEKGSRVLAAIESVCPREPYSPKRMKEWNIYDSPTPGKVEECFYVKPRADRNGYAVAALRNAVGDMAVSHIFPVKSLPCLALWKNEAGMEDGYVTGIEPATNYPNFVGFERKKGRVVKLGPGKSWSTDMTIIAHTGRKEVRELEKKIQAIQSGRKPEILLAPQKDLSAFAQ